MPKRGLSQGPVPQEARPAAAPAARKAETPVTVPAAPVAPAVKPTPLTPTSVRNITRLIQQKAEHVIAALEREVTVDAETIREKMLAEMGHSRDRYELQDEIRRQERELSNAKEEVENDRVLADIRRREDEISNMIVAEVEQERQSMNAAISALKTAFSVRKSEIEATRENRVKEIAKAAKDRMAELTANHAPGLQESLNSLKAELAAVRKIENDIEQNVKDRAESLSRSRSRLIFLVRDASSRAQEGLIGCASEQEAKLLLDVIPTVSEVIRLAESPENGIQQLVSRLVDNSAPVMRIEAPKPPRAQGQEEAAPPQPATSGTRGGRIVRPTIVLDSSEEIRYDDAEEEVDLDTRD